MQTFVFIHFNFFIWKNGIFQSFDRSSKSKNFMTNFDFDEFEKKLKKVTKDIFISINSKNVCGLSWFSDDDAGSISASFNTISHLENNWKKYPDRDKEWSWNNFPLSVNDLPTPIGVECE